MGRSGELLVDDLVTEIDAFVTNVDAQTCDQLLDLALALAAKPAEQLLVAVCRAGHVSPFTPFSPGWLARSGGSAVLDHSIDDAVVLRFLGAQEVVALHVLRDFVEILVRVPRDDLLD